MSLKAFNLEYLVGHHNIISPLGSLVVFYTGKWITPAIKWGHALRAIMYTLMMMLLFYCSTIKNSILLEGLCGRVIVPIANWHNMSIEEPPILKAQ